MSLQAVGLIDTSEFHYFITQLNEIGRTVDVVNAEATWLRVQVPCCIEV